MELMFHKDKGKGKAVDCLLQEPLSIDDQIACLKKELDFKNEVFAHSIYIILH